MYLHHGFNVICIDIDVFQKGLLYLLLFELQGK